MISAAKRRVLAHQVASRLLTYPDKQLVDQLPLFERAANQLPVRVGEPLSRCCSYLSRTPLADLEMAYVETFDMRRRCCLYLTYYSCGDTRNRGSALLAFTQAYLRVGMYPPDDELPDHLAVLLEFSACGDRKVADQLFRDHRVGIDTLGRALRDRGSHYADVLDAVCATLPRSRR